MAETADVVIVGGGIVGCSVAFHLAERRAGRVVLLERSTLGSGTSSRGSGGVRLQFSTAINIQLSLQVLPFFEQFKERFGVDIDYYQRGYLFLADNELLLEQYRRNVALQREFGVPSQVVTPAEIREIAPYLNVDDVIGGAFCPKDGRANPQKLRAVFADQARAMGVEIREGVDVMVTGLLRSGDRVTGVRTPTGEIESPVVVNACGPWAAALSAMAGVDEPVTPLRRQQFLTEPPPAVIPRPCPFIIDPDCSFSWHMLGDEIRAGITRPGEQTSWLTEPDWDLAPLIEQRLVRRVPALRGLKVLSGYAGLYEMSPDSHAIIGWAPSAPGLLLANGFSGHGLMHSPITGKVVAEIILDGAAHTVDVTPLRPTRFAEGAAIEEGLAIV